MKIIYRVIAGYSTSKTMSDEISEYFKNHNLSAEKYQRLELYDFNLDNYDELFFDDYNNIFDHFADYDMLTRLTIIEYHLSENDMCAILLHNIVKITPCNIRYYFFSEKSEKLEEFTLKSFI